MCRSLWKGFFVDSSLLSNRLLSKKNYFNTWSRRSTILKSLLNQTIYVHNGKTNERLLITSEMLGYKVGDFIFTRKRGNYKAKKKTVKPIVKKNKIKK